MNHFLPLFTLHLTLAHILVQFSFAQQSYLLHWAESLAFCFFMRLSWHTSFFSFLPPPNSLLPSTFVSIGFFAIVYCVRKAKDISLFLLLSFRQMRVIVSHKSFTLFEININKPIGSLSCWILSTGCIGCQQHHFYHILRSRSCALIM